jgi:uncharacterized phiE125 gp8 family phage protein
MRTIISQAPAAYPVTLTQAKLHLRLAVDAAEAIAYDMEDELINGIIAASTGYAESFLRRAIITTTFITYLDRWQDSVTLPFPPLQSIEAVTYTDADGNQEAFTDYTLDTPGNRVVIDERPNVTLADVNPIAITYKAGYGADGTNVPAGIKHAILLMIGHYYQNREAVAVGVSVADMPMAVDALLWPYRDLRY